MLPAKKTSSGYALAFKVWRLKVGPASYSSSLQNIPKKKERKKPWFPYRNAQASWFVCGAQTLDVAQYFWELE